MSQSCMFKPTMWEVVLLVVLCVALVLWTKPWITLRDEFEHGWYNKICQRCDRKGGYAKYRNAVSLQLCRSCWEEFDELHDTCISCEARFVHVGDYHFPECSSCYAEH